MIDIKTKIHDKFSVEFKFGFVVRRKLKQNDFAVNTWFFVPNSLDINSMTYPKDRFYSDLKSNIRLITPVFLLRELVSGNAIPLHNLENAFNTMASAPTRTAVREYEYQIKMFMAIFKSSIRNELQHITRKVPTEDPEYLCQSYIDNLYLITSKYRDLRKIINAPTVSDELLNNFLFGDEFMSNSIEQHTFQLINTVESLSEKHKEIVEQLKNLIRYEQNYKKEKNYLVVEKKSPNNNQGLIFRLGILKKYIESDLFLKSNKKRDGDGIFVEQVYYSIAAGVSMIFATAVAFSFQQRFGNFTMPLFVALVVSYMLKDRIKDLMRYYFAYKLGPKYFDHKTTVSIKDLPIGWIKEGVDFITEDRVPREVMDLRNRTPLLEAENRINDEKIMLYRKRVQIDREKMEKDSKYILSGINDIMRFHINHFIQKADNPKVPIYILDENDSVSTVEGDKVYFLNIIMQFQYEEKVSYKRFRVVFRRTGIIRIEEVVG
jgi:hypothetical protein